MSSDKSEEFSLEDLEELDLDENEEKSDFSFSDDDDALVLDLSGDDDDFQLSDEEVPAGPVEDPNEFSLTNVAINLTLTEEDTDSDNLDNFPSDEINLGDELKEEFSLGEESSESGLDDLSFDFDEEASASKSLDDFSLGKEELLAATLDEDSAYIEEASSPGLQLAGTDMTEDIQAKLKEIDAIMEEDATNASLELSRENLESFAQDLSEELAPAEESEASLEGGLSDEDMFNLSAEDTAEVSLVGSINLSSLDLGQDNQAQRERVKSDDVAMQIPKKKRKKEDEVQSLDDISQAYSGEMERTQATISNLRADRDELLKRIDVLEEEKLLGHRNFLSQRAELDEKKIELTIIRKKLNEEINDLKDRIRIFEERVLILEEKNKQLHQELDSAGQRNRIDVKRVMLRERELEQKLELLKADAETQIRNRDLKILELKRKIDGMEFDMESISQHEKKTLESRFELEDKLDKAIRTLRTAISTLEDDGSRSSTLEAIKKNIEL